MSPMNRRHHIALIALGLLISTGATALELNVVGLFPNKALVQIDGGVMQTLSVGQKTRDNIVLLSVTRDAATFDVQGRRMELGMGPSRKPSTPIVPVVAPIASNSSYPGAVNNASPTKVASAANHQTAVNYATVPTNDRGHMVADGEVNGMPIRFTVDTGATFITLPVREAIRLAIDYKSGQKVTMETANGEMVGYRLKLDTVRVGELAVYGVDAVITENDSLPIALLGMSFLNRVDMKREGTILTLTKR
jgi:aspartyl protease family protein